MTRDERAVRDALTRLDAAFQQADVEAVLACCTDDIVFIGSGAGEEATGRTGLAAMFEELGGQAEGVQFELAYDSFRADVHGDIAIVVASGEGTLSSPRRSGRMRYRLTGVLVRVDGRWLWRLHHGSEPAVW